MVHSIQLRSLLATTVATIILAGCSAQKPNTKESADKPEPANVIKLTANAVSQIGIISTTVEKRAVSEDIATTGQIQADENKVFHINSLAPGRVIDDRVLLGDVIRQGQTLAVIENLEVARIYADFVRRLHENEIAIKDAQTKLELAKANLTRIKQLFDQQIAPQKDMIQAQADFTLATRAVSALKEKNTHIAEEARSLLGAYGVKLHNIASEKLETTSPIVAPRSGVITKKSITVGDVVAVQQTLYEVADLSQVWLDISIYDKDLARVKEGLEATFVSDSLPGRTFTGRISYIRPSTGDNSRTFLARVILPNPHLSLKPGMFGPVKIRSVTEESYPFVPDEAVQTYGKQTFVFLDLGGGEYRRQPLELGKQTEGGYLVHSGINVGDRIVTKGSFNLKANILKSQFAEED